MAQSTPESSHEDSIDDLNDTVFLNRGCCSFFNFPCFNSGQSDNWERISTSDKEQQQQQEEINSKSWWDKGIIGTLKRVREWSELVAGPKWKTFIRRFNKTASRPKQGKFQYDPLSYARNFDDGPGQNGHFEDDRVFRDFSSRYAAIPGQNGQLKDAPVFHVTVT
ncbi:hypothetical protein BUALT_Bualt04G0156400 [Buddleja alternifolia]|uniref:Uncharacterized protein n=1 Tax=Buddleja alternifolia TaxID=168488 RepID=A0AAV6Y038_9LAMI|nr:hypothetical protein BUALT_Bualt04G0156400 [Buddleja alternifolia]